MFTPRPPRLLHGPLDPVAPRTAATTGGSAVAVRENRSADRALRSASPESTDAVRVFGPIGSDRVSAATGLAAVPS